MSRRPWALPSAGVWLAIGAVATFLYTAEHWRRGASRRARSGTHARLRTLTVCLLGPDGPQLVGVPSATRGRLRALALQTSTDAEPTWLDRCVPIARGLAAHGGEVDATGTPGEAATQVAARARDLALALGHVGLVWQIRAGTVERDMDRVADLLVRATQEVDLAGDPDGAARAPDGPVAPRVVPRPEAATAALRGLVPLPHGTPSRFLVAAPLPLTSVASPRGGRIEVDPLARDEARYWRLGSDGLVRVDAQEAAADGLAPVSVDTVDGRRIAGRVAPPPRGIDRLAVSLDVVAAGRAFWLAEAVRGQAPVLARIAPTPATAVLLAPAPMPPPADGDAGAAPPALPAESVAVGADARAVWAAYTTHGAGDDVRVTVVRAVGGARAAVAPVGTWQVRGRHPGLAFCNTGRETWLFAAARGGWRAGVVRGGALVDVRAQAPRAGFAYDEDLTVRCGPTVALAYGRERPRSSPLWRCGAAACAALPAVPSAQARDLPVFTTYRLGGARVAHAEWPLSLAALDDGAVLAARAFGPLVAVARLPPGGDRWQPERVVFDAAAVEPGALVQGVELYAEGARAALAIATADELRASISEDTGRSWRAP